MGYTTRVDAHHIDLRGAFAMPHPADFLGGLIAGLPNGRPRIVTGIAMGPVRVEVQRQDAAPLSVAGPWEDVVEVSCRAVGAHVLAAGQYDDAPDPGLALNPPGTEWFRLRVHARGRDLEYDAVATVPREEYLLIAWPHAPAPPTVLSARSRTAQQFTAAQARRRLPTDGQSADRAPADAARIARRGETGADAQREAQAQANLLRVDRQHRPLDSPPADKTDHPPRES